MRKTLPNLFLFLLLISCTNKQEPLFENISAKTGIDFTNELTFSKELNPYTYRNFYNGGGVGLGDINNDGYLDVFFAGNIVDNKLYLNNGDLTFTDITETAQIASENVWSTGVSMADVNGDGWLDIYVSKSGTPGGENRHNELFINNGDLTFTEMAEEYGIDDTGLSNHSVFFDFDKDNDLDLYLLNNSFSPIGKFDMIPDLRQIPDPDGGNKLYRNDGGHFTDVTAEAGIYSSKVGFGLGVSIGDLNRDSWPDIYVSNDFFERDYFYLNNQDGTFTEVLDGKIASTSMNAMGADIGDLNHDGYPEIYVTDMLPEPEERYKTKTQFESWDRYIEKVRNGYHFQFTRNALQLNIGNGEFIEIGRMAGVEATDWSWAALMADLDQNGNTDLFIANGIYQDLTDMDYINYYSNPELFQTVLRDDKPVDILFESIPSVPVANYAYSNEGELRFENRAQEWGLGEPGFSNGSAYGDLDNDGDLDLVINNVNMPAFVYRNRANEQGRGGWLQVRLEGLEGNTQGIGAQLSVWTADTLHWREQMLQRGFQSSVDPRLHIGLGGASMVDSLAIVWPDGKVERRYEIAPNQALTLHWQQAGEGQAPTPGREPARALLGKAQAPDWSHTENPFVDFDRDRLAFHMRSTEGPAVCAGQAGADGRQIVYLGGARDQAGGIWQQDGQGEWSRLATFPGQAVSEDVACVFLDADGDGDEEVYVASGGNEFGIGASALHDRLYVNQGGEWELSSGLPAMAMPTGAVAAGDWDGDGDIDLFVGERLRPFAYGRAVDAHLLVNDGTGVFEDKTASFAPELTASGLYTGGQWADVDGDGDLDLITAGEWSPIRVYANQQAQTGRAQLEEVTAEAGLEPYSGWWNQVLVADLDGDGDEDIVGLNHGLNSRFRASFERPASLWVSDFDGNGSTEQVLSTWNGEDAYPMVLRHDLVNQLPGLKKKYLKYEAYKGQTVHDIFTPEQLERAEHLEARSLESAVFWNDGSGRFSRQVLPQPVQYAPMYAAALMQADRQGARELFVGGNLWEVKPEAGRYDASKGVVLQLEESTHSWRALDHRQSGLEEQGQIRGMVVLQTPNGPQLLIGINNDQPKLYKID